MKSREPMISIFEYWSVILLNVRFSHFVLALILLFIVRALTQRLTNKGPMIWPLMGVIPSVLLNINDVFNYFAEYLNQCGGTFAIRATCMDRFCGIMTVDTSSIEYILKTNFVNYHKGEAFIDLFSDVFGNGFFVADGETWKDQRLALTSVMHTFWFIESSHSVIQDLVHQKLLKLINKSVKLDKLTDLQDLLLRFTSDNIYITTFGIDPGCLAIELPDVPFVTAFERAADLSYYRVFTPTFIWKTLRFFSVGPEKKLKEAVRIVHKSVSEIVKNRRIDLHKSGSVNDRSDVLSRLVIMKDPEDKQNLNDRFSDDMLRDLCLSFILAGRDTTSVALAWFFWLINKHPHVENLILNEIKVTISHRKCDSKNINEIVFTADELKKMVYLEAALSETLRLYPSVPHDIKEAREDDVLPNGTAVKKKDLIVYSMYSIARTEAIWGKDCREFKPERWIKNGKSVVESQFKFLAFNGGPRLCVGKQFAYIQMKMVAASILLRYSVKVVEGQTVVPKVKTTLYMKNGLLVNFKPRLEHTFGSSTHKESGFPQEAM
ncbi:hypothetical protein C5167_048346 [Papaver somniferum]|uniref:Cytochrome P450 n=1 Tax=Papaver somniferum TaxID=3469 RepID=A0A4Y7KHN8_PAPSO|nr:cytochrome P450 86B1-like [Papaver somniferum]RZC72864.1 hypothetical protein C5167_048346 [Papaver somniferum]